MDMFGLVQLIYFRFQPGVYTRNILMSTLSDDFAFA